MAFDTLGILFGSPGSEDVYGSKPNIAPYDWSGSYAKTIADNQALLPESQKLASSVNAFNSDEVLAQLRKAIPGYDAIVKKQSTILQQQLAGEVPDDVARAIRRNTASREIYGGFGRGSGAGRNLEARDLGLTSLQITNQALQNASGYIGSMRANTAAPLFNVSSMFIDPMARIQLDAQRADLIESVRSAPDPVARGQMDTELALVGMILSAYGGGAGYQGTHSGTTGGRAPSGGYGGGGGGWGYSTGSGGPSSHYIDAPQGWGQNYGNVA